jgi:hypothetical protein
MISGKGEVCGGKEKGRLSRVWYDRIAETDVSDLRSARV